MVSFRNFFVSRRRVLALLVILAVLVLSLGAYGYYSLLPINGPRMSSLTYGPLRLSMELDKTEYQRGENITIKLWLENISNKNLTIVVANWLMYQRNPAALMLFDFDIVAENGTTLYNFSNDHVTIPAFYEHTVGPGENLTQTYLWDQTIPDPSGKPMGLKLSSGAYSVRGITPPRRAGGLIETDSESWTSFETPPIAFVIR